MPLTILYDVFYTESTWLPAFFLENRTMQYGWHRPVERHRQMRRSQAMRGAAARSRLMNSEHLCYGMASACLGLHLWATWKGRDLSAFPFSSNEGLLASFFDSIHLIVFKITCSFQTLVRQDSCAQMKWLWACMLTTGLIFCLSSLCAQWPCWWIF